MGESFQIKKIGKVLAISQDLSFTKKFTWVSVHSKSFMKGLLSWNMSKVVEKYQTFGYKPNPFVLIFLADLLCFLKSWSAYR